MRDFVCVSDFERRARPLLPSSASSFYYSGADDEVTLQDNSLALQRLRLRPSVCRDVAERDLSTTLLGEPVALPIGISPTSFQRCAWPDGEVSTAKAAQSRKTCFTLSAGSTSSIADVSGPSPQGLKWLQIYLFKDREANALAIRQAESFGFKALVLTVDAPVAGHRRPTMRDPLMLPPHMKVALAPESTKSSPGRMGLPIVDTIDDGMSWTDVGWLKSLTSLPIVAKGVMTAEDAILAVEHGISAVWVSNHGGRQLDTVPATIDLLPEIVSAVGDRVEVYVDCGFRTGTDVLKGLALGARAVFIGRPVVWGLSCKGQEGVEQVLDILKEELSTAMAFTGCRHLGEINSSLIVGPGVHSARL